MTCKECPFCWKDESEKYPCCHFEIRTCWDIPPCEYDDCADDEDCPYDD